MAHHRDYRPQPVDTSHVQLDGALDEVVEKLAENAHAIWAKARLDDGWTYGESRDDARKTHPSLVPFAELSESEKNYDRKLAVGTLAALLALGYRIAGSNDDHPAQNDDEPGARASSPANRISAATQQAVASLARGGTDALRAAWQTRAQDTWATADVYAWLGERLRKLGDPLFAYEVLSEGHSRWKNDQHLQQLLALALADLGATGRAQVLAFELRPENVADPQLRLDIFGLRGRTSKDLGLTATSWEERVRHLERALAAYRAGLEHAANGDRSYLAINAATVALLLDRRGESAALAAEAARYAESELTRRESSGQDVYWQLATLGESALIRGDREAAAAQYRKAIAAAGDQYGDVARTRRQARVIARHLGIGVELIDSLLPVPRVVVFAGHAIDDATGTPPRFRPDWEPFVSSAILDRLNTLRAGVGFSGAAAGSDVLFLEAMAQRGGRTIVVLPYNRGDFARARVLGIPGGWRARFDVELERAWDVVEASGAPFVTGGVLTEYASMLLLGLATIHSRALDTELIGLAVWDGSDDGVGGTADAVGAWRARGIRVEIIAPAHTGSGEALSAAFHT